MVWKTGEGDPYVLLASLLWETEGIKTLPPIARTEGPIGVDVERVRPRSPGLPRYALDDREYAWFQSRGSRWEDFYALWTLKEARVKCTGEGIFKAPARQVSVPLLEPGENGDWEGFSFSALSGEGWRGALCLKNL